MTLNEMFHRIINLNEIGDADPLDLSDPDGVRSGKSGWSFGVCQFDTKNNPRALDCLRRCGCTPEEIDGVVNQTVDVAPINAKLHANADIVADYDDAQLQYCLDAVVRFGGNYSINIGDTGGLLALADTVNQYGSIGDGTAAYCRELGHPPTADDVLTMKLTWKYSQTADGKADTIRRAHNIDKVLKETT